MTSPESTADEPQPANDYLAPHAELLLRSYHERTGRHLLEPSADPALTARRLFELPFFVASHNTDADPILTYGNRCALDLFEMSWEQFVTTPSRFTAEAPERDERARLLDTVARQGYIDDYSGIRVSRSGRRFRIHDATVWNLSDKNGTPAGQAATFSHWEPIRVD